VSFDVSRSSNPRVSSLLGFDVKSLNAKSALTIGDLRPLMFPEAAVHASALYWALTIVQELRLMALIFTPLITSLMVCL